MIHIGAAAVRLGILGAICAAVATPASARVFYLNYDLFGAGAQSIYQYGSGSLAITTSDTAAIVDGRTAYAIDSVYGTTRNYFGDNSTDNVEQIAMSDYLFTSGLPFNHFPGLSLRLNDGATVNLLGFADYGLYYSIQYSGFFRAFDAKNVTLVEDVATSPGSVPEPASWSLMIAGFGLAGAKLRRRKSAQTAAA